MKVDGMTYSLIGAGLGNSISYFKTRVLLAGLVEVAEEKNSEGTDSNVCVRYYMFLFAM